MAAHSDASGRGDCAKTGSVVALGMFDGVHIGHQELIRQAITIAHEGGWRCVVYTFKNHPRSVYDRAPRQLMDAATRRAALYALGVDQVDMVDFTKELAERSPEAFIDWLTDRYLVKAVVAGRDFTFGYKGLGTIDTLRALGAARGFTVHETGDVMMDGVKVSSTRIRAAIQNGQSQLAAKMLGR